MLPTNLYQLLGLIVSIAAFVWMFLQGWKWWLVNDKEIKLSRTNATIAEAKQNILTAAQVAELMKNTQDIKSDIVLIKHDHAEKSRELVEAVEKLEENIKVFESTFTRFLINRVNQFDESLIKTKRIE